MRSPAVELVCARRRCPSGGAPLGARPRSAAPRPLPPEWRLLRQSWTRSLPIPDASRLPDFGPHGEGWVVLQLLLGASIAGGSFVGVYWPGALESFFAVLGLLIIIVGALLVVLGVLSLGRSFTPLPRPRARTRLRQGGIFKLVRHPRLRGRDLDRTWLVPCRRPARPRPDNAAGRALRPQGAARGGLADRTLPRIPALPGTHAAPACAMALLSPRLSPSCPESTPTKDPSRFHQTATPWMRPGTAVSDAKVPNRDPASQRRSQILLPVAFPVGLPTTAGPSSSPISARQRRTVKSAA